MFQVSLFGSDIAYLIENEISEDFVLETKKIEIPGFPGAFNPSIIRWNDSLLMCFRVRNQKLVSTFEIGLVLLDDQFNPICPAQILDLRSISPNKHTKEQDPKLVCVGGQLYLIYSNDIEIGDQGSPLYYSANIYNKNPL